MLEDPELLEMEDMEREFRVDVLVDTERVIGLVYESPLKGMLVALNVMDAIFESDTREMGLVEL